MSAGLLLSMKRYTFVKTLLGICPFILNERHERVTVTARSTCYSVIYILSLVTLFSVNITTFIRFFVANQSKTRDTFTKIVYFSVYIIFILMLVLCFYQRHRHERMLNSLAHLYDRVQATLPAARRRNLANRQGWNAVYMLAYFLCPFSTLFVDVKMQEIKYINFYILHCHAVVSILASVVHIQDILLALADCFDDGEQVLLESNTLSEAHDILCMLHKCVGGQLLLNGAKDLLMLVMCLYSLILEHYNARTSRVIWLYYFAAFIVPLILKNSILIWTVERLEYQFDSVRKGVLKSFCDISTEPRVSCFIR